jgi:metallophosphoesterase superfamily enzyme
MLLTKNLSWEEQALSLYATGLFSKRGIAKLVGAGRTTCREFLNEYEEAKVEATEAAHDNSRILVLSDLHAPYHHPNTIPFIKSLIEKYKPTRYISVGDEQDLHASSFHDSDVDLYSAGDELKAAQKFMRELESLIPEMDILSSNHGDLFYRKAKHHGIPMHVIKSYNDVLGVGDGWKWHNDMVVDLPKGKKVYFCHGKSANGLKLSQAMGMSCVQGHYHNTFNIQYWSSPLDLHFSMQVGCLIDDKSLAMSYNKLTVGRPVIGCGLIIDGVPVLEAMPL